MTNSRLLNIDYRGVEFTARRQMTRQWMLLAGLTLGRNRGVNEGRYPRRSGRLEQSRTTTSTGLGLVSDDTPVQLKIAADLRPAMASRAEQQLPACNWHAPQSDIHRDLRRAPRGHDTDAEQPKPLCGAFWICAAAEREFVGHSLV